MSAPTAPSSEYDPDSQVITPVSDVTPELFGDLSDTDVLYEDATCKITKVDITLKAFYFPFMQDKVIPLSHIMQVNCHRKFWMSATWGLNDASTWWCKDSTRVKGVACLILRTGGVMMKGFSPNRGNPTTVKQVADLLQKIITGGPGMVKYLGY